MNIKFIGPRPEMIRLMGNKVAAREAMEKAGLPLLPGARGKLKDAEEAERIAEEVGFPVILKAAAGGGGRGMKICREPSQVAQMFETAATEALAAFGDGDDVPRALRREAAPHRDPDRRRRARPASSTSASASARSSAATRSSSRRRRRPASPRSCAREMGEVAVAAMQEGRLQQRRHHRVPAGRERAASTSWR